MRGLSGSGLLAVNGTEAPVRYDLVQTGDEGPVEGHLFGDADLLHHAFLCAAHRLRLEDERITSVVLRSCEVEGAADVRVNGPLPWD